jgi:hypothetical protein
VIADHLERYYEAQGTNPTYEIVWSHVVDGHEVAWAEYSGEIIFDITGQGREGEPYRSRALVCECDFIEGVGWEIRDGKKYTLDGGKRCFPRMAIVELRYLELRRDYLEQFSAGSLLSISPLGEHIREIMLDMIERVKAGEFMEDSNGAAFWGGYYYLQTVAKIADVPVARLWEDVHAMMRDELIGLDGMVVQPYREPPPVLWEEVFRIEDEGWVGIASLPGESKLALEWKLEVKRPDGEDAFAYLPGLELHYRPDFGPDASDVARAEARLREYIVHAKKT